MEHAPRSIALARVVAAATVLLAIFAVACGATVPAPADAGSDADGSTGDGDASSADGGFAPIPCAHLTCAGATPYCLQAATCGYGPTDCTATTSDGGSCPAGYAACDDSNGKPGCAALYTYSCVSGPACERTGPRTFGNCTC